MTYRDCTTRDTLTFTAVTALKAHTVRADKWSAMLMHTRLSRTVRPCLSICTHAMQLPHSPRHLRTHHTLARPLNRSLTARPVLSRSRSRRARTLTLMARSCLLSLSSAQPPLALGQLGPYGLVPLHLHKHVALGQLGRNPLPRPARNAACNVRTWLHVVSEAE